MLELLRTDGFSKTYFDIIKTLLVSQKVARLYLLALYGCRAEGGGEQVVLCPGDKSGHVTRKENVFMGNFCLFFCYFRCRDSGHVAEYYFFSTKSGCR